MQLHCEPYFVIYSVRDRPILKYLKVEQSAKRGNYLKNAFTEGSFLIFCIWAIEMELMVLWGYIFFSKNIEVDWIRNK